MNAWKGVRCVQNFREISQECQGTELIIIKAPALVCCDLNKVEFEIIIFVCLFNRYEKFKGSENYSNTIN